MIPSDARLYSWLDVQDVLVRQLQEGKEWPAWLLDLRLYWDGLYMRVRPGESFEARKWLSRALEPRITPTEQDSNELEVLLETKGDIRTLPVSLEESSDQPVVAIAMPTLSHPSIIQRGTTAILTPSPFPDGQPPIFAFHSFKGGVGRTLHALALAQVLANNKKSVLLVDADFEAPGITWLLESRLPTPPISFADLLALAHGEADVSASVSIDLVADRLQDASLNNIYVLPAFRSARAAYTLDIRPEYLIQGRKDPFVISNLLASLGRRLAVDAIVVDLRAGLSELSAGILLDPRIQRIFVTSMGGQSLNGTEVVLDILTKRSPSQSDIHPLPCVLLNEVPTDLNNTETLQSIEERLLRAVSGAVIREPDSPEPSPDDLLRGPSWFNASLLTLPSKWDDVMEALARSRMHESVASMAATVFARSNDDPVIQKNVDVLSSRQRLAQIAEKFIFAETGAGEDFLPISPLRRLVDDHRTQLPSAVVVGAKGAGKTYTYLQVLRRDGWAAFARDAGAIRVGIDGLLSPLLQPKNVSGYAATLLDEKRRNVSATLNLGSPMTHVEVQDQLRDWLGEDLHEGEWRDRWLDLIAWSVGYQKDKAGAGRSFPDHLKAQNKRVLVLIDGLEDLFQQIGDSVRQQSSVRALIQEVPTWLEQLPDRMLGIMVFIRRDMVTVAVRQNSAQLMARYEPYALRWDSAEALRLVLWISDKAKIVDAQTVLDIRELNHEELVERLVPLWANKLGKDRSREGRSAEWVIAALSDFRGQIQARDVVRFLSLAAKRSLGITQWSDRVLAPTAIRDAVADCSIEKISEIKQENPAIGRIFEKLRVLPDTERTIPFRSEDVHLDSNELLLLELNGVVVADEGAYYMPEIFRRGLEFRLPSGARPKVLALARRRQALG